MPPVTESVSRAGSRTAVIYSAPPRSGGSGLLVHQVLRGVGGDGHEVHALGPRGGIEAASDAVIWYDPPPTVPRWAARTWLRWRAGEFVLRHSRAHGQWSAAQLAHLQPRQCYAFSEVGLEGLRWARANGIPTVLDSPTGHIRHFHDALQRESERWCGKRSPAHPSAEMVSRVEEEYDLADRIRGGSAFVRRTMIAYAVPGDRIDTVPYNVDLDRFPLRSGAADQNGPLRVCFVGMLALHKGFVYLLRAARLLGPSSLSLRLIGGTVDRDTRRLFERERRGLDVVDGGVLALVPELHRAEILVLPTLHDGFGFVAAEAMAAGLPVIVTDQCGAAEWVRHGETGWVIPAGDERALAGALALALDRRRELPEMGRAGRAVAMRLSGTEAHLRAWVRGQHQPA